MPSSGRPTASASGDSARSRRCLSSSNSRLRRKGQEETSSSSKRSWSNSGSKGEDLLMYILHASVCCVFQIFSIRRLYVFFSIREPPTSPLPLTRKKRRRPSNTGDDSAQNQQHPAKRLPTAAHGSPDGKENSSNAHNQNSIANDKLCHVGSNTDRNRTVSSGKQQQCLLSNPYYTVYRQVLLDTTTTTPRVWRERQGPTACQETLGFRPRGELRGSPR